MKTNFPKGSMNKFDYREASLNSLFGLRWPALIAAVPAIAADLFAFIYLLNKSDGMGYAVFPMLLMILGVVFAAVSFFTDYRFKYSVIPILVYILLSAVILLIFLYTTVTNLNVTMTTAGYVILLTTHILMYAVICTTVFKSNRHNGKARKNAVKGIITLAAISALSIAYCAIFGFFGQGIGIFDEEMTVVYNYNEEDDSYTVADVLRGRGNRLLVPSAFNGKPVSYVSCNVFTKNEIKTVEFDSEKVPTLTDLDLLKSEINSIPGVLATSEQVDAYREQFFTYAVKNGNCKNALLLCNSVSSAGNDENEITVSFAYDPDNFPSVAQSVMVPTIRLAKGSVFNFADYTEKIPFFSYISPETLDELSAAYTDGEGYFLLEPSVSEGQPLNGATLTESVPQITLSFDRVYLINLEDGNDTKYTVPTEFKITTVGDNVFDGKFVCRSELNDYINSLPTRNGLTVSYTLAANAGYEVGSTFTQDALFSYLESAGGHGTVTPVWSVIIPVLKPLTSDKGAYVYGDEQVVLNADVTDGYALSVSYRFFKDNALLSEGVDSAYTVALPVPADSGVYSVQAYVTDDSTALSAESTPVTLPVNVAKKQINASWTLPDGEVYDAEEHTVAVSSNPEDAVRTDSIDVIFTTYYGGEALSTALTDAGDYTVTAEFVNSDNNELYEIVNANQSFNIQKATANVVWTGETFEYDSYSHRPTVTVTGVNGTTLATSVITEAQVNAGSYTAIFEYDDENREACYRNYSYDSNSFSFTVTPKPLTVTWDKNSFVYTSNGINPSVISFTGICDGDTVLPQHVVYSEPKVNVGDNYTATASFVPDIINYSIANPDYGFEITPLDLNITVIDTQMIYKNAACSAYNIDYSALGENDSLDEILTLHYGDADGKINTGTYTISLSVAAEGEKFGNYNVIFGSSATLTVSPRPITVSVENASKTYDGYTFTDFKVSVDDLATGDLLSEVIAEISYGNAQSAINAGDHDIVLSAAEEGEKYGNYSVSYSNATLTIAKRELNIRTSNTVKIYDGSVYGKDFALYADNLAATDTLAEVIAKFGFGDAETAVNAGSHAITLSVVEQGAKYANYDIKPFTNATYTINKLAITVTADNKEKEYDGLPYDYDFTVTHTALAPGQQLSDVIKSFSFGAAETDISAGKHTIKPAVEEQGEQYNNYSVTFVSGTLDISKRPLNITVFDANKTYDGKKFTEYNVTADNLAGGDTLSEIISAFGYGAAESASNAGEFEIKLSAKTYGSKASNYNIESFGTATLTIEQRAIVITADNQNKTYDGKPFTGFTVSADGLAEGDTIGQVVALFGYGDEASGAINAGTYTIALSVAKPGTKAANYATPEFVNGTLTISKKDIVVTADDKETTYSGSTFNGFTFSIDALATGDKLSDVLTDVFYGSEAENAVNAGTYTIAIEDYTEGGKFGNYNIVNFLNGQLIIKPKSITVTANSASKEYDTEPFNNFGFTVEGLVGDDKPSDVITSVSYGAAEAGINAGSYDIVLSYQHSDNYTVTAVKGTLTITKAPLTVTVQDAAKTYDGKIYSGTFNVTAQGCKGSDLLAMIIPSFNYGEAATATDAGEYDITLSAKTTGEKYGNYEITFVNATLTITPAALTVTAHDQSKTEDGNAFSGEYTYDVNGLISPDSFSDVISSFNYGEAATATAEGEYAITLSAKTTGNKYKNYDITFVDGTLTIYPERTTIDRTE